MCCFRGSAFSKPHTTGSTRSQRSGCASDSSTAAKPSAKSEPSFSRDVSGTPRITRTDLKPVFDRSTYIIRRSTFRSSPRSVISKSSAARSELLPTTGFSGSTSATRAKRLPDSSRPKTTTRSPNPTRTTAPLSPRPAGPPPPPIPSTRHNNKAASNVRALAQTVAAARNRLRQTHKNIAPLTRHPQSDLRLMSEYENGEKRRRAASGSERCSNSQSASYTRSPRFPRSTNSATISSPRARLPPHGCFTKSPWTFATPSATCALARGPLCPL
ncbi:hypothetical protein EI94DRAFT_1731159 [Lactarius quietus]|nr:hypothetical protein EI94DRAFT_1731159 [Lactarius quietus]